jgi:hypothetical protein
VGSLKKKKESTGNEKLIHKFDITLHLINFYGGGQVISIKSATALILDRCGA